MLVKSLPGGRPSAAEKQVTDLLATWTGQDTVPGLLLMNVHVPHAAEGTRQVPAMVFTPAALTVLEIQGLSQRQTGTLHCPRDSAWTIDEAPALWSHPAQANPLQQLNTNIYATGNALQQRDVEPTHLGGLVVIAPEALEDLHIAGSGRLARGVGVLLADGKQLRRHFGARRHANWSADRVLAACDALAMTDSAPTLEQLIDEGFPAPTGPRLPALRGAPNLTLRTPRPAVAPPTEYGDAPDDMPTPPRGLALSTEMSPDPHPEVPQVAPSLEELQEPAPEPLPRRERGRVGRWVPLVLAVIVAVIAGLLLVDLMRTLFH